MLPSGFAGDTSVRGEKTSMFYRSKTAHDCNCGDVFPIDPAVKDERIIYDNAACLWQLRASSLPMPGRT